MFILVGTTSSNDVLRGDGTEVKFETLHSIDQSSDAIGIERQHSSDQVIIINLQSKLSEVFE